MNIRFVKMTCLLSGLMGLASAGYGQSLASNVHVPFGFIAGGKSMPAGDYTVSDAALSRVLLIQGSNGNSVQIMPTSVGPGPEIKKTRLTFERRGTQLVLSRVETSNETVRLSLGGQGVNASATRVSELPLQHN